MMSEEEREVCRTAHSFSVLEEFFGTVETQLVKVREEQRERLEKFLDAPEADWAKRVSARLGHLVRFDIDWQRMETYSFVVFLNMVTEIKLKAFCGIVAASASELQLQEALNDIESGGLDRIKTFLKLSRINVDFSTLWQPLTDLQLLRNCICHAGGKPAAMAENGGRDKLEKLCRRIRSVSIDEFTELRIERTFLRDSLDSLRRIFRVLYETRAISPKYLDYLQPTQHPGNADRWG